MEQRTKSNDKWNYNDDRSGILKTLFLFYILIIFVSIKVHQIIMTPINNVEVDGEQIHLHLIVILIHVVHNQDEIVRYFIFTSLNQFKMINM